MTPSTRALLMRGLLSAGLTAATLTATLPAAAHAAPAHSATTRTAMLADPSPNLYEEKMKVLVKFGLGERLDLAERTDRDFVVALWTHIKDNKDHLEVRVAAEAAYTAEPDLLAEACRQFILVDVFTAFDRDVAREKVEADEKRRSDLARAAAAAAVDIVADAPMLSGDDAKFLELIADRVDAVKWPKVKAGATAARKGTAEQQSEFIGTGLAATAKQDTEDRIAREAEWDEAQKAAARARAAKKSAAELVGMEPTDRLLNLPDRDFVTEVWNNTPDGSEVQAAAIRAARSNEPDAWKTFINTGVYEAKDRDRQIAFEKAHQANRAEAERLKALATESGDLNLLHATKKALAGAPDVLADFLRVGQYDLDLATGLEADDVHPTWSDSPVAAKYVANVSGAELRVRDEAGHGGKAALVYAGSDDNTLQSHAYLRSMALSRITVKPTTTLSYWIHPQSGTARPGVKTRNSTCVAIDLAFSDGSNLRDTGLKDQRGNQIHPAQQCSKLTADRWNHVVVKLGGALADKQITGLHVGYDQPNNIGGFRGLIDDITITDQPVEVGGDTGEAPDYPADKPVRDFNSDGKADVFVRKAAGELLLYRGNGKGYWIDAANSPLIGSTGFGKFTALFSPGDFNGDGLVDVIARTSTGDLLLYRGNGKGSWIDPSSSIKIGVGWDSFTAVFSPGDFNGDGNSDVIARLATGELRLYRGNGKGGWIDSANSPIIGSTGWGKFTAIFSPGDFNGDGFSDVIVRNTAGDLLMYRGNGKGSWVDPSSNIKIGAGWNQFNLIF
ncbi:FG-GAP repeat domain-containing protein [Couchioplanes caeruleus]|uniref:VCBS repeat protein n=1 Tax=Couchioplanes caeruleus subsp. caeruleus TaxID=56427 RepID=A0A1K0FDV5_9ACTN|nr:VCBS repeat-containing protein [Couchioplanes caeruleus]OJF11021.1 hypothetical protein BG844_28760 [Couchioplanes caeruleus subsp. caeruleus]